MVFGETDYTSYHAVRFFITKDQQSLANNNNEMGNSAKALELNYEQFRDPYRRGALNMDYNDAMMKNDTNLATYPDQRRAAEADAKAKAQSSTQAYDMQGVKNAFRRAFVTKNYGELGQQLSTLLDDDVLIQPQQDGTIAVASQGQQAKFNSLDEIYQRILMKENEGKEKAWSNADGGYQLNQVTGETRQYYQPEPKQQAIPLTNTALDGLTAEYVDSLGLDMSTTDKQLLQSDIQAGTVGFMRQGDSPSLAMRKSYDQLAPSMGKGSSWFGLDSTDTYKGGGALDMGTPPAAIPAPSTNNESGLSAPQAAIDYLKANNTPAMQEAFRKKYGYLPR